MGKHTHIGWCDSSGNTMQGCEGCELSSKVRTPKGLPVVCYAEILTNRFAGTNEGFPKNFFEPIIRMERLPKILAWSDLTGKDRPDKPWLNGLPRLVFLNDMGDTFTRKLPADWFAESLEPIKASPHQYLILSKWPQRFAKFSERHELPNNIWAGTSITKDDFLFRIAQLRKVKAAIRWLSIEPLWSSVAQIDLTGIHWVVVGGESGINPTPCGLDWIEELIAACKAASVPIFIKQLGGYLAKNLNLKDVRAGADPSEWPEHLRVHQFPKPVIASAAKQSLNRHTEPVEVQKYSRPFNAIDQLHKHITAIPEAEEGFHQCPYCSQKSYQINDHFNHIEFFHPNQPLL